VTLHGYQASGRVRQLLRDADIFICTSHEEGLGLPLLEAQYGGLPIVAPDAAIFREVLNTSGIFIDPADPAAAAAKIATALSEPQWRSNYVARAAQNLERWNTLASTDRDAVINLIAGLAERQGPASAANRSNNLVGH
jgi:glycosyltransferase involved in cell wall biosynthesis